MDRVIMFGHDTSRSGAPKILLDLCEYLKNYYELMIVILRRGSMQCEYNEKFNTIYLEDYVDKYAELVDSIIDEFKPKVVFANTVATYECAYIAKQKGIPVIMSVYELQDDFNYIFQKIDQRIICKVADFYIANSELVFDYLVNNIGCDSSKITYIPCFSSKDEVIKQFNCMTRSQVREKLKIPENDFVVMNIANCTPKKGIDKFLDVFFELRRRGSNDIDFISIGEYDIQYIETFSNNVRNIDEGFHFLGEQINPYQFLKGADAFVFPSKSDSFGLVVLAAMQIGLPTVVFKQGCGLSGIIEKGNYGIVVDRFSTEGICDALMKIIRGEWKRSEDKYLLEMFEKKNVLPQYKKFFEQIVNFAQKDK